MRIAKAVRNHLRADTGVSTIVGQKVHLRKAPARSSFPHTIVSVAAVDFISRSNAPRVPGGWQKLKARVQVDSYCSEETSATAEDDVDELAEAISAAFDGITGTVQGIEIQQVVQVDERDNYERLQDGSDDGIHRITQDYEVTYKQPT